MDSHGALSNNSVDMPYVITSLDRFFLVFTVSTRFSPIMTATPHFLVEASSFPQGDDAVKQKVVDKQSMWGFTIV